MTESYHATQSWLSFIGEPTTRIEDPTDGVVQLYTEKFMVRVRVGNEPASQSSVIAMMRAGAEIDDLDMFMFSPTGYNASAIEFAETRNIALFTLTSLGDVVGETASARAHIPVEEFIPPFADREDEEDDFMADLTLEDDEDEYEDPFDISTVEWKSCPRCNAKQHPNLVQCAACGADLNGRVALFGGSASHAPADGLRAPTPLSSSEPPAQPRTGMSTLQCRNCGSHDIELIHG